MATEDHKALVRRFVAAADRLDVEAATHCLSPAVRVHLGGMPGPVDFSTFVQFGQAWHAAFPDEQTTFEDQLAEGDRVVSRMASTATHTGTFQGTPPTGKRVTVTGIWTPGGGRPDRRAVGAGGPAWHPAATRHHSRPRAEQTVRRLILLPCRRPIAGAPVMTRLAEQPLGRRQGTPGWWD